jgi:NAD dependent epimerase/dehydratase family enzyme
MSEHHDLEGVFNCTSPNPVNNEVFMRTLRDITNQRIGLPATAFILKIGAALIGTETELILKSRWVLPTKLLESGFRFKHGYLEEALKSIVRDTPKSSYHLF